MKAKKNYDTTKAKRIHRTITKHGYYYYLVEIPDRPAPAPMPCFDGNYGFALTACRKIN